MSALVQLLLRRGNSHVINKLNSVNRTLLVSECCLLKNSNRFIYHHSQPGKLNNAIAHRATQRPLLKLNDELNNCRSIRTTNPNRLPPVFWLLLRPAMNVIALLGGRRARQWWRNLSEEQRQSYRRKVKRNQNVIFALLGGIAALSGLFYASHIEESPITKRKRFIALSKEKFNELSDLQFMMQLKMFENKLLPNNHPLSRQVERVATRIIKSNLDIEEFRSKNWTTAVIDAPNVKNAMVVGDGKIFVFTGMLNVCENDDSLGFVLAHEIAHSVLSHGIEILSYSNFLEIFVAVGVFFLWSVMPTDFYALIATYLTKRVVDILFSLPWNRDMEVEADKVGMLFHAKSCYDVREGVAFWLKMDHHQKMISNQIGLGGDDEKDVSNVVEFLSTHPAHDKRAEYLESMIAEAIELRKNCGCGRLPYRDPITLVKRKIELQKKALPQNYTLIRID